MFVLIQTSCNCTMLLRNMCNAHHITVYLHTPIHSIQPILMCSSSSSGNSSYTCAYLICSLLSLLSSFFHWVLYNNSLLQLSTIQQWGLCEGITFTCAARSAFRLDKGSNSMQLHMDSCNPPSSRSIVKSSEGAINNLWGMFLVAWTWPIC